MKLQRRGQLKERDYHAIDAVVGERRDGRYDGR